MSKTLSTAALAAVIASAVLASTTVHAQSKPLQNAPPQPRELDPAKRVPPPAAHQHAPQASGQQSVQAQPAAQAQPYAPAAPAGVSYEEGRGGFFIGVQGGKGWVYDDIDQSARMVNAGYRWQAGAVTLVGIEVAGGKLDNTTDRGVPYAKVDYASIGANARFNFGRTSPVYALVRAGYFNAEEAGYADADGGYVGVGLGVDFNRHFNLNVVYTSYAYFDGYGYDYENINSADTLMLGAEVRF
ncbi:outer membrane beta-barrel protein [Luteimonas sp. MJ246]|uniref:outer membrane protein n=1 Tax=Luteimonas sp. MJ174 TaxID=3129237 RepID=UPI0031B9F081